MNALTKVAIKYAIQDNIEKLIVSLSLLEGSVYEKCTPYENGNIDVWFTAGEVLQHRCISVNDLD